MPPISGSVPVVATAPEQGNLVDDPLETSAPRDFSEEELDLALSTSKRSSSPGLDGLPYAVFRFPAVKSTLLSVCNSVLRSGVAPPDWSNSGLVPLFKKGDSNLPDNYRGIALMSTAAKLYNKMILKRVRDLVDTKLRSSQNGFRPHRSCPQHILALRRVIENCRVFQKQSVVITFIDFQKAFDSVHRSYLVDTLVDLEIPAPLIRAIMSLYWDSSVQVVTTHGLTDRVPVRRGVLQGDTLAPYLFVLVIDRVLRESLVVETWGYCVRERRSSRFPAEYVTDLTYADDIAVLSTNFAQAELMLHAVASKGLAAGLAINLSKTKVLVVGDLATAEPNRSLSLDGVQLERVSSFVYLGAQVPSVQDEIAKRLRLAAHQTGLLQSVWSAPLSLGVKARVFRALIDPILFYACETWTTPQYVLDRIRGTRNRLLRRALGVHWPNRILNSELLQLSPPGDVIVEERRLRSLGHFCRFIYNPSSLQPLNNLLWFTPQGATRRPGLGALIRFIQQITRVLQVTEEELRGAAFAPDKSVYTRWYQDRCAERWGTRPAARRLTPSGITLGAASPASQDSPLPVQTQEPEDSDSTT